MKRFRVFCLLLLSLPAVPTSATDFTWVGDELVKTWGFFIPGPGGGSTNWSPESNLVPGPGDTVTFDDTGLADTVTLSSPRQIDTVTFNSDFGYTLEGESLQLLSGDLETMVPEFPGPTHTIDSDIILGAEGSWEVQADLVLNGAISGGFGLSKKEIGRLTLNAANTYTGDTTISGGSIILGDSLTLQNSTVDIQVDDGLDVNNADATLGGLKGSGNLSIGSQTLTVGGNHDTTTYSGVLSGGSGSLIKNGSGTLTLTGANTYTGDTTVSEGTLVVTGADERLDDNAAVLIESGAVLNVDGITETINSLQNATGTLELTGGATLQIQPSPSRVFPGTITGGSGTTLAILGGDTQRLSGANPGFSGVTQIDGGRIRLDNANALQNSAVELNINDGLNITSTGVDANLGSLAGSGNLIIGSRTLTVGGNGGTTTYSGVLSGISGSLVKNGAGTLTLSGANTYGGETTITGGSIRLGDSLALQNSTVDIQINDGLDINNANATLGGLKGSGNLNIGSQTLTVGGNDDTTTYSGVISGSSGSLIKTGSGTLTLSGANSYTGGTIINGGAITVSSDSNLGSPNGNLTLDGGTLQTTAPVFSTRDLVIEAAGGTISGTILLVDSLSGPGDLSLNGFLLHTGSSNTDTEHSGTLSGTGSLTKSGSGRHTLSGVGSVLGGELTLTGGVVEITEALQVGGLDLADGTTLDGHAPDMPDVGDAQPGQSLTVTGNVIVEDTGLVDLRGAIGLDRKASQGNGSGMPGADGGSFDSNGNVFELTGTNGILLQGGRGGRASQVNNGDGAPGGDGGAFSATASAITLSGSATIDAGGGTGGNAGENQGDAGRGGNAGSFTATATTISLTGSSEINLNGADGGSINDEGSDGGRGGNAGSFSATATTITLADSAKIDLSGGVGRVGRTGGAGGDAGSFTTTATTLALTGSASIDLNGADGASGIDRNAGAGGKGGLFSATAATTISLADSAMIELNGANGGGTDEAIGGAAGSGGQFEGGSGLVSLSGSAGLSLDGGDGGDGEDPDDARPGANAGSLVGTFDLDLSGSAALSMQGGDGRRNSGRAGGNGASLDLADGRSLSLSDNATVNLSGGEAIDGSGGVTAGDGGAITMDTGASLTIQDTAEFTSIGGRATSNGVVSGAGGSITLLSGTVTIDGGAAQLLKGINTGSAVPGNNGHVTVSGGAFQLTGGGSVETDEFNFSTGVGVATIELESSLTAHDQVVLGSTTNPLVIDQASLLTDKLTQLSSTTPTLEIRDPIGGGTALTVGINNGDSTFNGTIQDAAAPGSLAKTGSGTFTLTGANTYSGGTTLSAGTLSLQRQTTPVGTGTITIDGASTLEYGIDQISIPNALDLQANATISNSTGFQSEYRGDIGETGGSFGITKIGDGLLSLKGNNSHSGGTILNGGRLGLGSNTAAGSGTITVQDGTILATDFRVTVSNAIDLQNGTDLSVGSGFEMAVSGVIGETGGSFGFIKPGAGVLILSAANTYSGGTTVSAGTLLVDNTTGSATGVGAVDVDSGGTLGGTGSVAGMVNAQGGTVAPGDSAGVLTVGGVSFDGSSTFAVELGGADNSDPDNLEFDQLAVTGDASLDGTLDVSLLAAFTLSLGQSFEIIDVGGSLSGTFGGLPQAALVGNFGGTDLFIDYSAGDGNDIALVTTLAGDFDLDFDVDGFDFLAWQRDPSVGLLSDWETNYGMTLPLTTAAATVPEPASLMLACAAFSFVKIRYRRTYLGMRI